MRVEYGDLVSVAEIANAFARHFYSSMMNLYQIFDGLLQLFWTELNLGISHLYRY